jgi:hypothetical protein
MTHPHRQADIETLARIAARFAGRDPDEHLRIELGGGVVFYDQAWRYHDFLTRAEAAYHTLTAPHLVKPPSRDRGHHPTSSHAHRTGADRSKAKSDRSVSQ